MAGKTPTFKPYHQHQIMMLPPSLEDLVPKGHPVRVVNDVINRINLEHLLSAYQIKGTSSYHPQMLLKVWFTDMSVIFILLANWKQPAKKTFILCG
jgi:hypothetical protein